jgi:Putative papain-like cysteine peptidase (DUF1796)
MDIEPEGRPWRRRLRALQHRLWRGTPDLVLVRGAFEAVFGRPPDARTAADLAASLDGSPASVQRLLDRMLDAPEAQATLTPRMLRGNVGLPAQASVISLGTHCYTSAFLQRWGLREWSGPFDWIFASVAMVAHCLEDDFAVFLDRGQYEPIPPERRSHPDVNRVDHRFYRDRFGVASVFNHHDVHLDAGHAYLVRCVERFRSALASPGPKLFVLTSAWSPRLVPDLQRLAAVLADRTPDFRLVALLVDQPGPLVAEAGLVVAAGPLAVYRVAPRSAWEPLQFEDPTDEICLARLLGIER